MGLTLTTLQDPRLLAWFNARAKAQFEADRCRWVAGFDENGVIFVVVYSRFSDRNCEMHIESDGTKRWATRRSLRLIFSQPFTLWNISRVTFLLKATGRAWLDVVRRLGAHEEGRIREYFDDCDGIVMGMLKRESRWHA